MSAEETIRDIRLNKLAQMRELGHDPYSVEKWDRTNSAQGLIDGFVEGQEVSFAGRVVSYRLMGKAGFAHLSDGDARIQIYVRKDDVSEQAWQLYNLTDLGDHVGVTGKLFVTKTGERSIQVDSYVPLSKALEPLPLGKEKDGQVFSGLTDVETRYRHRHLDLIANQDARKALVDRAKITSAVRRYFDSVDYIEVETPLLQLEAGGAAARPFQTHYNAYEIDVKLRISLELYLKRLICGDLPRVYEIGRVFRNEGVSNRHNPEFTLLEFYESYANLETMMQRVEECFESVAESVFNASTIAYVPRLVLLAIDQVKANLNSESPWFGIDIPLQRVGGGVDLASVDFRDNTLSCIVQGDDRTSSFSIEFHDARNSLRQVNRLEIELNGVRYEHSFPEPRRVAFVEGSELHELFVLDFGKPWRRVNLLEEIERHTGLTGADLSDLETAKAALRERTVMNPVTGKRIDADEERNLGGLIEKLLEVFVEPTLQEPTFVVGYPIETSPLAKKDPSNPRMTRRFEGYVRGREVCNAFSEINDPIDQRERFEQQLGEREKGDDEAHPMDEEFIYALECGMPPTGGCGIGIDRMAMLLTGSDHIREVLFFPFMRPHATAEHPAE